MDNRTEEQRFEDWVDKDNNWVHIQDRADALAIWIGAKHDAKPIAEFHYRRWQDGGEEYFLLDSSSVGRRFKTKVEAEEWAVANGYRLE